MKTNFFRSTIMLILVLIVPVMCSTYYAVIKYSYNKNAWPYVLTLTSFIAVCLIALICIIMLVYSFFFAKSNFPLLKNSEEKTE